MAYSYAGGCNGGLQVYGFGIVLILGSFATAANTGAGLPAVTAVKGKGFSVSNTSTGTYTLTFTNSALSVLSAWLTPQVNAANVNTSLQFGAVDVVTALTAVIRNAPAGAVADMLANANNRIHFGFCMATSSLNS